MDMSSRLWILLVYFSIFFVLMCVETDSTFNDPSNRYLPDWYSLDVIPKELPSTPEYLFIYNDSSSGKISVPVKTLRKNIPRILWVAVKNINDSLPDHFIDMIKRNSDWTLRICDNQCKDDFMNTVFANTSILALYHLINPTAYASKADIWRYCALYTYGGLYLDDDSLLGTPLSEIVSPTDNMILSEEGPSSLGDCFIPSYHLHDENTFKRFQHNASSALFYHGIDNNGYLKFFHGNTIVNWGIFSRPRHPILYHTLKNIVDILYAEYRRHPVLHIAKWDQRWKYVLCGTNFVLTYTMRELALLNDKGIVEYTPRICHRDFQQYYGKAKAIWTGKIPGHYMKAMNKDKNINILREHAPLDVKSVIAYLEGSAITGETKDVYLVKHGTRRPFGSYDNFLAMNFTDGRIRHVRDQVLQAMPLGPPLTQEDISSTSATMHARTTIPIAQPNSDTIQFLKKAQEEINRTNYSCFGDDYTGTRDDFLRDAWKNYIGNTAVMAYPMCLRTFQLGNTLGYLLNDLACSDIAGAHFIAISKHFDISGADPNNKMAPRNENFMHLKFFEALPDIVVHSNPLPPERAKELMKSQCQCLQYCWENTQAPWTKRIPLIADHLKRALLAYMKALTSSGETKIIGDISVKTQLNNETDSIYISKSITYHNQGEDGLIPPKDMISISLPLVPDVTIQYRCGDNIGFGKTRYGLLPFRAFKDRIPGSAKYIYIIADAPTRSIYHPYSGRCSIILSHLGTYLHKLFPSATLVIKRGGDLLLDYVRIAFSSVVVCSASTFCLWPALANENTAYFPLTPLVAGAWSNETAPDFGRKSFNWIKDVLLIKEFKSFRPWTRLIEALEES